MKEIASANLKLRDNVFSEVSNPLVVALDEGKIAILIGLKAFEFRVLPALLILVDVFCDVIIEELAKEAKLEVVLVVELLALLSLDEVIALVLIAVLYHILFKFLLSNGLQLEDNAILNIELCAL